MKHIKGLMDSRKDMQYQTDGAGGRGEGDYFSFLVEKAEKLSSAVYLVTSLLSDTEPMKWILRESGLDLLSDISIAEHAPLSDRMMLFEAVEHATREMVSLVSVARTGRIISPMNADLLIAGFNSLREAIGRGVGVETHAETIVSELLRTDEKALLAQGESYIGQKDNGNVLYNRDNKQQYRTSYMPAKKRPHSGGYENVRKESAEKTKENRKQTIIDLIKKTKEVTIKDVLRVVSGCSEKTIQRELVALVKDNVLKKEGERRWSRYSLK